MPGEVEGWCDLSAYCAAAGLGGSGRSFREPVQDSIHYLSAVIQGCQDRFGFRMAFNFAGTETGAGR